MKYFTNIHTLDELKKAYRRLAMIHHPDVGGDPETMKAINNEHDALFEQLKKQHNATADENHQTTETPEEFREIIEKLLTMDGLDVELCGSWLWIGGETMMHKDALKAIRAPFGMLRSDNSTIPHESLSLYLFIHLSKMYCSPTTLPFLSA